MSAIVDIGSALRSLLLAETAVETLVSDRVFVGELPASETGSMPRAAVVIRGAGGPRAFGGAYQDYRDDRIDVRCYGVTPHEANTLWRTIVAILTELPRTNIDGVVLHWAREAGGPIPLRDPDTDWPFEHAAFQVLYAETAAA